jgi:hypothetical protein
MNLSIAEFTLIFFLASREPILYFFATIRHSAALSHTKNKIARLGTTYVFAATDDEVFDD